MKLVPRQKTPAHVDSLRVYLHHKYHTVFQQCPGDIVVSVAWAQCVFEHGWDKRSGVLSGLWNYNVGNIDAPRDTDRPVFVTVKEREVIDGAETKIQHLRYAYYELAEGVQGYWRKIQTMPDVRCAMGYGAEETATALRRAKYYTGSVVDYAKGMQGLVDTYNRRYEGDDFFTFCGWLL